MKKIKRFLPTLREKKRYLVFEVISKQIPKDIVRRITDAFISFVGTLGQGVAGLQVLTFNEKTKKGIIRVNNKYTDNLRASLALTESENTIIKSTYVSGMLNKAQKKVNEYG